MSAVSTLPAPDLEAERGALAADQHFVSHIAFGDGCWEWTGSRDKVTGYGRIGRRDSFTRSGKTIRQAHRWSWMLAQGAIPVGLHVLHKCDNRPCVRPAHLFLGTATDNMRDMVAKGRRGIHPTDFGAGSTNPMAKLDEAIVAKIREALAYGELSQSQIAKRFGSTQGMVSQIGSGLAWKDGYVPSDGQRAPVRGTRHVKLMISFGGETMSASDWSRRLGVNLRTLCSRIGAGWAPERALTEPARSGGWPR